jgi:CspA family cold shock protein
MTGRVATWDEHAGYGTISANGAEYFFHCTQLVDGSRTTRVGTPVTFEIVAGRLGKWEAVLIEKTPSE